MAKQPNLNRERSHALYQLGNSPAQIAAKLGISFNNVRQWAVRGQWAKERDAKRNAASTLLEKVQAETLADVHLRHKERISRATDKHIDSIVYMEAADPQELVQLGQALKHFNDVARVNLGMSQDEASGGSKTSFNFNLGAMTVTKKCELSEQTVELNVIPLAYPAVVEIESTQVIHNEQE